MTVIKSSVFPVLQQFPDRAGDIKRLYKQSRAFQTVCDDYRLCTDALRHWKHSSEKEAATRRQEYEQLFRELMDEIYFYLDESV